MLAKIAKFNAISYQVPTGYARSSRGLRTRKINRQITCETSRQRTRGTSRQKTCGTSKQEPRTAKNSSSGRIQFCLLLEPTSMMSVLWRKQRQARTRHFRMLCWKSEYEKKWCWETIVKVGNETGLYAQFLNTRIFNTLQSTDKRLWNSYQIIAVSLRKLSQRWSVNSPSKFACNFTMAIKIALCRKF